MRSGQPKLYNMTEVYAAKGRKILKSSLIRDFHCGGINLQAPQTPKTPITLPTTTTVPKATGTWYAQKIVLVLRTF